MYLSAMTEPFSTSRRKGCEGREDQLSVVSALNFCPAIYTRPRQPAIVSRQEASLGATVQSYLAFSATLPSFDQIVAPSFEIGSRDEAAAGWRGISYPHGRKKPELTAKGLLF
jgi:hypothetical protein